MVIPRPIEGKHRTIKNRINVFLYVLFLVLPFIRVAGRPILLLDIPARKFHIFGLEIWPHELYFLHLILLMSGLMLFFFTALFGRIWCGYGCPQTIFLEFYDAIARLFVGGDYGRKPLAGAAKVKAYIAYTLSAIFFSFIFLAYFKPFELIFSDIMAGKFFLYEGSIVPAPWVIFMFMSIGFALFNAGYFRENVCHLVCPYGRFQTALLDKHSPIVSYDVGRGEPRREGKQKLFEHKGDCVDCNLCNLVCPTGIDIRQGLQIGCIACGLCVDACTQVLGKHNRPTLIDYRTIEQVTNPDAHRPYVRPRTIIYGSLLSILLSVFIGLLIVRVPIYGVALKDRGIQSSYVPGQGYQNVYELHVGNVSHEPIEVKITVEDKRFEILASQETYKISAEGLETLRFVVRSTEENSIARSRPLEFKILDVHQPKNVKVLKTIFTYPVQG